MKIFYCGFITAFLMATLALAQDNGFTYQTPEYSGPMAGIDGGGMGRAGSPDLVRAPVPQQRGSDRGYEREIRYRDAKISAEMERRREEARIRAYNAGHLNE